MNPRMFRAYERELGYLDGELRKVLERSRDPVLHEITTSSGGRIEDPFMKQLLDGVALLNARTALQIEDAESRSTEDLLQYLLPHATAGLPSCAIVQFSDSMGSPQRTTPIRLPAHQTILETDWIPVPVTNDPNRREKAQFRTCFDVDVWPVEVKRAGLRPATKPTLDLAPAVKIPSEFFLDLQCIGGRNTFSALQGLRHLDFHVGDPNSTTLYAALVDSKAVLIEAPPSPESPEGVRIPVVVEPLGLDYGMGVIPSKHRAHHGYRLLAEHHHFPQKFHFLRLHLPLEALAGVGNSARIVFGIDSRFHNEIGHEISGVDSLGRVRLNCTPVVNLFTLQPTVTRVHLTPDAEEHLVIPDPVRGDCLEVYSIDNVRFVADDGTVKGELRPHQEVWDAPGAIGRYCVHRRLRHPSQPSEVFLSASQLDPRTLSGSPSLELTVTCSSGNLIQAMIGGSTGGKLRQKGTPAGHVATILAGPFLPLRPNPAPGRSTSLLAHVLGSRLPILSDSSPKALMEALLIYSAADWGSGPDDGGPRQGLLQRRAVNAIERVSGKPATARLPIEPDSKYAPRILVRGTQVTISVKVGSVPLGAFYLMGQVLSRFFAEITPVNSFVKLTIGSTDDGRVIFDFPPRSGQEALA